MIDIQEKPLRQIAAELRRGTLSARSLADGALANDRLGAYRERDQARTDRQADAADTAWRAGVDLGPLQGVPISVKDLFGVPGWSTFAGSPRQLPRRFEVAGPVVSALLGQLAVVTGKTHTVEFAFGGVGSNPHYPTPINPWDGEHHRAPGGSTAGGGVSLSEGSALLALGTDTAGSVRIPASWTGNVALKPTHGRWSTAGIVPLSPTLDTPGVLAREVDDLILACAALDPGDTASIEPPELSRLTLGRHDGLLFEGCSSGVVEAVEGALAELTAAGATVTSLELPEVGPAYELFKRGGPVGVELHHFLATELPDWLETLEPNVRSRIGDAGALTAHEYLGRLERLEALGTSARQRLGEVDVLVSPTVANSPPRLDEISSAESYGPQNLLCLRNTSVVSYLGFCAVTIPVGLDTLGLPVGLQLIGRPHEDERLLAIALAFERRLGRGRDRCGQPPRGGGEKGFAPLEHLG